MLNEKLIQELDEYAEKLVTSQPKWLKKLFRTEVIVFIIDDDGDLGLHCKPGLGKKKRLEAERLILDFLDKNPNPLFGHLLTQ